MKQSRYWTIDEITKIIELTNQYSGSVIRWDKISSQFKARTTQQCKSFFSNKVKPYTLQKLVLDTDIGIRALCYFVSEKDDNLAKHLCLLNVFNQSQEHIRNIDQKYFFDVNVLRLIRSIIITYIQNKYILTRNESVILGGTQLNYDQISQIVNFMNSFNYEELLQKVTKLIPFKTK
ncbi:Myb-like_DNA-binding domain-containing protein [Hexamita inflata]|uniref:Myb-like DNA-binding domain-containing protein n=1 Tax=Hexamita inflata TaxID=28002 RepID=A0AA86U2M0_9EUKA|nr:Myb-like DNA-binding domain-containing protein [Hexamita inflata]